MTKSVNKVIGIDDEIIFHDVIVIGSGLAGLRSALESSKNADTAIISKVHPLRSHSVAAQGGINAALSPEDSWKNHAYDTIKGSDYLADQDAVKILTQLAPDSVYEMERFGTLFSRTQSGEIAQRPFGGAMYPRTCYAADRTGHNLLQTLFQQIIKNKIKVYEEYFAISLIINKEIKGLVVLDIANGVLKSLACKALIIATGGFGRIFGHSTNAVINTGDGCFLAYKAGIPLKDMEFVQFHPTTLLGTNILITEGARGEGGILLNNLDERFMEKYAPEAKDLAPRDIVARAIQSEIDNGRGFENSYINLDITHLGKEKINQKLPGIKQIAIDFAGIDPVEKPLPIQPGQHYSMGGIDVNNKCKTKYPGIFAVGECSCISIHGANRLGGNSLLETLVFGKIAGKNAAEFAKKSKTIDNKIFNIFIKKEHTRINNFFKQKGDSVPDIRLKLKNLMFNNVGVFREKDKLQSAFKIINTLKAKFKNIKLNNFEPEFNYALIRALELESMIHLGEAITIGALLRTESRGSHFRSDYPDRDDENWLKHTIIYFREDQPQIKYKAVKLGLFKVKRREY